MSYISPVVTVSIQKTTSQSIGAGVIPITSYTAQDWNLGTTVSLASGTITIIQQGYYLISSVLNFATGTTASTDRSSLIQINSVLLQEVNIPSELNNATRVNNTLMAKLNVSDVVTLAAFQNDGTTLNVGFCRLQLLKIG